MTVEHCYLGVCFVPLSSGSQTFFGFPEFLTGLALMVLAWTIADVRYRFRVNISAIPLPLVTFLVVTTIGLLTLLTDLWHANHWLVPKGDILTPATWQALLGALYLLTFLTWIWVAFIRPPKFSQHNSKRYAHTLYRSILKGAPTELSVIADELTFSANSIVSHATDWNKGDPKYIPTAIIERYANDLLDLIAHKRFCRAIVESSPVTAMAIFDQMNKTKKYGIEVGIFAKNIVGEALRNKDSFLYHETSGYKSGLIGNHQPITQAMFGNYDMVERIGSMFDQDYSDSLKWDADQWKAYCRIVLITFRSYVESETWEHSYTLFRAISDIGNAVFDLYQLNDGPSRAWDDDRTNRLHVVVEFITDAIEVLNQRGVPEHLKFRVRHGDTPIDETFYDHIANLIFEVIFSASSVKSPDDLCWSIQYISVWAPLFDFSRWDAADVVRFKVRRLLYDEVNRMKATPNFKGARILGFCLNVMGLKLNRRYNEDIYALHKAILSWTKKNFDWLHDQNPLIADACLVDGLTFDKGNHKILKTYPANALRRESEQFSFEVDVNPKPA